MTKSKLTIGVVMDPIESITPKKDSTLAMLLAAARRDWDIRYMEQPDLWISDGQALARQRPLTVRDDLQDWYHLGEPLVGPLGELDVILMRKDPPFDMEFVYTTYVLDCARNAGALVVNEPSALRDMNEKVYTAWFPHLCPATLIARSMERLKAFAQAHGNVVAKPLDGMGGASVFLIREGDQNTNVILETLTREGEGFAMVQEYVPDIAIGGDKRVLVVDGQPVPYGLARIPPADDLRGNLAVGGRGEGRALSEAERRIAAEVGAELARHGVLFAGLDIIGERLTEINVTSPTCIRELDREFDLDIAGQLMDAIERRLADRD